MWAWLKGHPEDLIVGLILAVIIGLPAAAVCAVIIEAFDLGKSIRARIRQYRDRRAERSISQLERRIAEQVAYRDMIASEDRRTNAFLRSVLLMLVSFGCAALLENFIHLDVVRRFSSVNPNLTSILIGPNDLWSIVAMCYIFLGIITGILSVNISKLDTSDKVAARVAVIEAEIENLNQKLLTKRQSPGAQGQRRDGSL